MRDLTLYKEPIRKHSFSDAELELLHEHEDSLDSDANNLLTQLEIIEGVDDRKRIGNTRKAPFRWICMLDLHTTTGIFGGTGVLVSPKHVLTAGHNLDDCLRVSVTPGISGNFKPFGTYESTNFDAHNKWKLSGCDNFDIGMIKLSQSVGDRTFSSLGGNKLGYWGSASLGEGTKMIPFNQGSQLNKKANLAGYPFDKGFDQLWWDAGKIVNGRPTVAPGLIYYKISTCGAQSGSPVWLTNPSSGSRFVIAIHSGPCIVHGAECTSTPGTRCPGSSGSRGNSSNGGVFLSSDLIKTIQGWIRSM